MTKMKNSMSNFVQDQIRIKKEYLMPSILNQDLMSEKQKCWPNCKKQKYNTLI